MRLITVYHCVLSCKAALTRPLRHQVRAYGIQQAVSLPFAALVSTALENGRT